jgi:hypothetical protein
MPRPPEVQYDDIDALRSAVEAQEGEVLLCRGIDLRQIAGVTRLKSRAREQVGKVLTRAGLVALPEVPEDQRSAVYVARVESEAEKLYGALNDPSEWGLKLLQGATVGSGALAMQADRLGDARALLAEAQEALAGLEEG